MNMKVDAIKTTKNIIKTYNPKFQDLLTQKQKIDHNFAPLAWYNNEQKLQKFKHDFTKTNLTSVKLLKMQYDLNYFFLKQQMMAKIVELPINSLKSITQSNV